MPELPSSPLRVGEPCPLCGEPLQVPTECSRCDWVPGYRRRQQPRPRNPRDLAALVLSIVPGAGHIFKGYATLGWVLMIAGVPACFVFAAAFTMFLGWLLVPAYWLGVAADAYFRKDLRPRDLPPRVPDSA